jgi:DNA invertase Pin-like site-specific DNA recombinase
MPFRRQKVPQPHINRQTGEVEDVTVVETTQQRRARIERQARQATITEQREQERAETGKKRIKHDYMPKAYPWESIRQYFVEGAPDETGAIYYPTINDICEYFHVSYLTVRKRLLEEEWIRQRDAWQAQLHTAIQKAAMLDYIEAASKFDATCVEAAQSAMQEILDKFHEAKAQGEPISNLDLDRMGRSAVNWQRVGRLALGLSTENTARHETKSQDTLSNIELGLLTNEELETMKQLLRRAESREEDGEIIEGVTVVQEQPQILKETHDEEEHQLL